MDWEKWLGTVRSVKDYSSGPVALIRAVIVEMEKKGQIWRETQPDTSEERVTEDN